MTKATEIEVSLMHDLPTMPGADADEDDGKSEPNNDKPVNWERGQKLPEDIYYTANDSDLEKMLPYLIGQESTKKLKLLASGRNCKPVFILREGILLSDDHGEFQPLGADTQKDKTLRRTGNDDRQDHPDFRRLRAVLGPSAFDVILKVGRDKRLSNVAALYFGVRRVLEVQMI